ncbi:MAG: DUF4920 domain-containing protein [Planctomycetota bacterium]
MRIFKLSLILVLAAAFTGCTSAGKESGSPASPAQPTTQPTSRPAEAQGGMLKAPTMVDGGMIPAGMEHGRGITLSRLDSFENVMGNPRAYSGRPVLVGAKVKDVCQKMGCWMLLTDGEHDVRVRFMDYGFFVPKDCAGSTAFVEGTLKVEEISEETARHYAQESKTEDAGTIHGPQQVVTFNASGVRLVTD